MKTTAKSSSRQLVSGSPVRRHGSLSATRPPAKPAGQSNVPPRPSSNATGSGQVAQSGPAGPGGLTVWRAGRPMIPPVIHALDANHDGVDDRGRNRPTATCRAKKRSTKNGDCQS